MQDYPKTRPGGVSSEDADKVADHVLRKLHADPEEAKGTRAFLVQWWVADSLIVLCISAVLFTGVPILGRVQWVNEAQAQQKEANEQVKSDVNARFDKLERKVDGLSDLVVQQVIAGLASDICRYNARRNKEADLDERARLLTQISQMRARYKQFTQTDFAMSDC